MDIIVLIKQVPNTTQVKIDPKKGTLIREGVESIVNPEDLIATEAALQLREQYGGKITAISMGPPQAKEALQEVLAMGADMGILLTDKAFAGADTLATSYTLGQCIKTIDKFDIVLCGRQAIDGDTAQIGPQVAEFLGIPQITYVKNIKITGKKVRAERVVEEGYEDIEAKLPVLVTVVKELAKPRYPSVNGIMDVCMMNEGAIKIWNAADIRAKADNIGLQGSATWVTKTFSPDTKRVGMKLTGTPQEIAGQLIKELHNRNLLR
ncbi:electron transfer flavoprotein subunit beta/FixA family protein [[Eubacterium] cellulosolvens]